MKKKLLYCLLPLACLATVSVSCSSSAQAAVLGDDYPSSWKYGGFGVDCHGAGFSVGGGINLERFHLNVAYGKYHVSSSSLMLNVR